MIFISSSLSTATPCRFCRVLRIPPLLFMLMLTARGTNRRQERRPPLAQAPPICPPNQAQETLTHKVSLLSKVSLADCRLSTLATRSSTRVACRRVVVKETTLCVLIVANGLLRVIFEASLQPKCTRPSDLRRKVSQFTICSRLPCSQTTSSHVLTTRVYNHLIVLHKRRRQASLQESMLGTGTD
jgi:hypothetical protein